jgi:hypothetical protein
MPTFVIGCALGALVAASIGSPFLLPWSLRVRYLAVAPMTDPWTGLGLAPRLDLRPVRLSAVESEHGDVELVFEEIGTGHQSRIALARSACAPSALAKLDGWMALRTTLLMVMDHGHAHVYGPDGAVTNLTLASERIR